ncbi:MAG: hypothetical protein WDN50_11585 [Bradyrhizobium sp.]
MKKLVFAIVLIASPAWAQTSQTKPAPRAVTARADVCAPIGRTRGRANWSYSLKCDNLPVPIAPAPPPQAEYAPPPEPEVQRGGLFGMSFSRSGSSESGPPPGGH